MIAFRLSLLLLNAIAFGLNIGALIYGHHQPLNGTAALLNLLAVVLLGDLTYKNLRNK